MKPAGPLLFTLGLAMAFGTQEPAPTIVSRDIAAKIRAGLPAYQPASTKASADEPAAPLASDPDVLVLPKMTVKEKRLPSDAADHLMGRDDLKRKLENVYLDEIAKDGELNYFLNQFTIPLFSPSKAERGKALSVRRELERLRHVSEAGRSLDPAAARRFDRERDNSHTTRPAGGLPKK